jgi:hypothetical protein
MACVILYLLMRFVPPRHPHLVTAVLQILPFKISANIKLGAYARDSLVQLFQVNSVIGPPF